MVGFCGDCISNCSGAGGHCRRRRDYGSIVSHKRETAAAEEALDRYKLDTGKQIAEANARQKEAELKLAKLRKLASPRSIDVETFVKTLEGKPKAHVQIWYLPDVSDVWMLSFQLKIALLHAGWQVDEPIEIPEPDSKNPLVKGMPRAMVAGGQPSGVTIVRDGTTDMIRDGTPAKALWDGLEGMRGGFFIMNGSSGSPFMPVPQGMLRIIIAAKNEPMFIDKPAATTTPK